MALDEKGEHCLVTMVLSMATHPGGCGLDIQLLSYPIGMNAINLIGSFWWRQALARMFPEGILV
jgi:hypothetical protein